MLPPAMLAVSALHLSVHRRRQIACRPGTWFRCDMGHPCLVSFYNMAQRAFSFLVIAHQKCQSTCNTLFFVLLCEHLGHPLGTHFPITQMTTDNFIESLKSEDSVGTDQKLWNICRHALFCWPYAPNHHSPKMDAHFAPHRARSLILHWTSEPIS